MTPTQTLLFDTETTGKIINGLPPEDPRQPRLVQLAILLINEKREEIVAVNLLVCPGNFEIPAEATAIHGITTEHARRFGVPLLHALLLFRSLLRIASLQVAHNFDYDGPVMEGEARRMSLDLAKRESFCTMLAMTPICNLTGPYGLKWPKLQEAHKHCFGAEFDGAHDALADVRATAKVFDWLMKARAQ